MYKQFVDYTFPSDKSRRMYDAVSQLNTWIQQHPDYYVKIVGVFLSNGYEFILIYYQASPRFQFTPVKLYLQFADDTDARPHMKAYSAVEKLNGWVQLHKNAHIKVVKNFINHSTGTEFILIAYQRIN